MNPLKNSAIFFHLLYFGEHDIRTLDRSPTSTFYLYFSPLNYLLLGRGVVGSISTWLPFYFSFIHLLNLTKRSSVRLPLASPFSLLLFSSLIFLRGRGLDSHKPPPLFFFYSPPLILLRGGGFESHSTPLFLFF